MQFLFPTGNSYTKRKNTTCWSTPHGGGGYLLLPGL
jgi:hypothetical protein